MRAPLFILFLLLPALLLAPTTGRAAAESDARDGTAIEAIAILSQGLDQPALLDAIALRLPEMRLLAAAACGEGCVNVRVHTIAAPSAAVMIEVLLEDDRVFVRTMPADGPEVERRVATLLAHLLTSIVTGDPPLVEDDMSLGTGTMGAGEEPNADRNRDAQGPPEQVLDPVPAPRPQPLCRETADPAPYPDETATTAADAATDPAQPMYELGPALGLVTVMGVGQPGELAGRVGSGTLLDLELRAPSGLLVSASGRLLDARGNGYRLNRLRLALAVGYGLRRGLFELRTLAAVSVEPWWVGDRADGARATFGQPLLGGALIVAPGVHAALSGGLRIHAGLRATASATAPPAGAGALLVTDRAGDPLFRLGGFELSVLAEIGARWGIRTRAQRATTRPRP